MKNVTIKTMLVFVAVVYVLGVSGCTNWEKRYQGLDVEHQNLRGLYENCVSSLENSATEKSKLGRELNQSQQTIEELQNQIEERNISVGVVTGFGEGVDVTFDATAGTITVTLPNAILFAPGKASLKKAANADLNHIFAVVSKNYADKNIDVVGHTDSDPIKKSKQYWQDNWELSAKRALSVLRYLTAKGIRAERIRAIAAGASRPRASNSTASGKAKNRRVEIVVNMR